jgi:hypothetical protein
MLLIDNLLIRMRTINWPFTTISDSLKLRRNQNKTMDTRLCIEGASARSSSLDDEKERVGWDDGAYT